jgi:DNA replication protein DnaC
MYELANKTFDVDETNKNVIWKLCLYFTGESGSGLDLNKGIYLYGPIGCGKTELMKWFKHNQTNSFVIFDVRQISDQYKKEGSDGIYRYKGMIESAWMPFGQSLVGICFDDLGTEVDSKHYGNEANVMADVFLSRYQNKNLHSKTHFTTNLNASMLKERYGDRVASRLREMVNIVEFPDVAIDRRK